MLWALYSLLSGFFLATSDALTKKAQLNDPYIISWSRSFFALPVALAVLFFSNTPKIGTLFWPTMIVSIPLEIVLVVIYIKAIRLSPLSLTLPFFNLTPVFLILTSFLILGEIPSIIGIFGILLAVIGAYILNISLSKYGLLEPFKEIFREKGVVLMIVAAFVASITANLVKVAVLNSSTTFYIVFYLLAITILMSIIYFRRIKSNLKAIKSNIAMLLLTGLASGISLLFHALAVVLVIVPYMISIKRTSSIFGVLYGHFIFKEKNIAERLVGAAIMLSGAVLILLA